MKKVKRRLGRSPAKKFGQDPNMSNIIVPPELEKVLPPSDRFRGEEEVASAIGRENPFTSKSHRCTYYKPSNEDFGQLTEGMPPDDYCQNLLKEICIDPGDTTPDTVKPELKNACEGSLVQTRSAFVEPASRLKFDENVSVDLIDDAHWQTIDTVSQADVFLTDTEQKKKNASDQKYVQPLRNDIRISETPRVKRIAEKFSKFKKNNIELRKLEERVVCLEYDIFDSKAAEPAVPLQKMRAFFSVKMKETDETNSNKENMSLIPSDIKRNFNIADGDLQKLNKREIEIIDENIPENRSLLEDLKRVLRRKQALEIKKRQDTLDLMCLYEMAKRESPPMNCDYSNTNLLSKSELQEIKDLILKKCKSSVYGINRKTIQCSEDTANDNNCVVSNSLLCELMREAEKV